MSFQPSVYQRGVFDYLKNGRGNFVVSAVAGSGKTTTLEHGLAVVPPRTLQHTWVVAFSKAIADELTRRQQVGRFPAGPTVSTFHSMGLRILKSYYEIPHGHRDYMNNLKYHRLLEAAWSQEHRLAKIPRPDRSDDRFKVANKAALTLIGLCQSTLSHPTNENLMSLAAHYEVELPHTSYLMPLHSVVGRVLHWGRHGMPEADRAGKRYRPTEHIAFQDMIWLPATDATIDRPSFELILVDEAQDLNKCQLELALSCLAEGGRIGFVGDRAQAIYGFAGADCNSIDNIVARTGATELPLSICYRCPKTVVELAQRLVPTIEPDPNAADGVVEWSKRSDILSRAAADWQNNREPWLIMCRMNAPLLGAACGLLKLRVPVYIRGREFAEQLLGDVDTIGAMDEYRDDAILDMIALYETRRVAQFRAAEASDNTIETFLDRTMCIRIVAEELISRRAKTTADEIRDTLNKLIPEKPVDGVVLSSIHRAKGLEANYAAILCADLLPHPRVVRDSGRVSGGVSWQYIQERNLAYVAITRAKRELWIDGKFGFSVLSSK